MLDCQLIKLNLAFGNHDSSSWLHCGVSALVVKLQFPLRNWQDLWRNDLNKCVFDNTGLFRTSAGKARTRSKLFLYCCAGLRREYVI